jgi:hypothetical protein
MYGPYIHLLIAFIFLFLHEMEASCLDSAQNIMTLLYIPVLEQNE